LGQRKYCGEYGVDTKGQYLKILEFKRFVKHFSFKKISETYSQKELLEEIPVDISHILGNLITVIFDYQILRKPLKILSL